MPLKLYNTLTRKKDIFKPIHDKKVGMYVCGPTVYYYAHIGNFRAYVFADTLRRVLKFNGLKIKQVMNLTDVGHLTGDGDEGEDKIEKEAKKERKTPEEIADFYAKKFFEDFDKLNNEKPEIICKATEHIKDMIQLIKRLEEKGLTYIGKNGNVYFDTSKLKDYGKLANLKLDKLKSGARIKVDEDKKNSRDFVLWFVEKGSKYKGHLLKWDSPWGEGWPGWHIECSAMSIKYLGEQFDIHTGGEDHIPVHHTNEIAQSEGATGKKPWVKIWMHNSFLQFNSEKMSKSKGGILKLQDLLDKSYSPMNLRYFYLSGHYKKPLNFTFKNLDNAKTTYQRLKNIISEIKEDKKINKTYLKEFENSMNDDLNTPKALQVLWKLVRDKKTKGKLKTIKKMDEIFGLDLLKKEEIKIPEEVSNLVKERENARKRKDWEMADELRNKINKLGYVVNDTKEGVIVKKND
ncbi:cysteine--tRNA ligase [Candidatus Pacearchaeota archaeon]|nr:cysteine--tRNA ligase [Candidatus Pacearchaeota archaeon]